MADWATEALALSPKLLLRLDEASGNVADSSGYSHGGTVTGSPTYGVSSGLAGLLGGITIASGSYFSVADHADLDLGDGPFSIEVWYKRGTSSDSGAVLGKADGSAAAGYIVNESSTDYLRLETGDTSSHVYPDSATYLNDTAIHHVVYTRAAGTNAKCYVDGTDRTSVGGAKTFTDNAQALLVGRGYSGGSSYAGATLHGIAIYKAELTSGDVATLYAARNTAPAASTYWDAVLADSPKVLLKLDEASGNAADSSGNGHAGTAVGTPLYRVTGPTSAIPWAITYPSGSYHSIADHADVDLGDGPFSIEGWFMRPTSSANGDVLGKADGSATSGYIVNMSATDYLRLEDGSTSSHVYPDSATYLNDTGWHHFCFTRAAATNAKCYIDGTDRTDVGGAKTFTDNAQALLVGRGYSGGSSSGMTLAGIAIYKTALSAARVQAHYDARNDGGTYVPPAATAAGFATIRTLRGFRS